MLKNIGRVVYLSYEDDDKTKLRSVHTQKKFDLKGSTKNHTVSRRLPPEKSRRRLPQHPRMRANTTTLPSGRWHMKTSLRISTNKAQLIGSPIKSRGRLSPHFGYHEAQTHPPRGCRPRQTEALLLY